MKKKLMIALWLSFGVVSLLAWIVYFKLTAMDSYLLILTALATANFILGVWIIIANNFALRTVTYVTLAFIVGQWWVFLWALVFIIWGSKGFAP